MMTEPKPSVGEPRIETREALRIVGLAEFFRYDDAANIPQLWQRAAPRFPKLAAAGDSHAYGVNWTDPKRNDGFHYLAGVKSPEDAGGDLREVKVPAGSWAVFWHGGHVSEIQAVCAAIFETWPPRSGHAMVAGPINLVEHYDSRFDSRTGTGGFEIWIPLKG